LEIKDYHTILKEYDINILKNLNYKVELTPWLNEGITKESMTRAVIGFFPPTAQITIPHFDINNRFVGLRGRFLCQPDIDAYGKYRPMMINKKQYNHPLGMNLYNLNNSKKNIELIKKAIVFEGEKSCLKYSSYFGIDNDISVACCGSNVSAYQI
jgi:DNA primase